MPATFFLSTGRCGTQWLAHHLQRLYGPRAHVVHEPLQTEYQPRRALAPNFTPSAPAQAHIESVLQKLATKPYIECGHPCWSSLPWIAQKLEGRLQIVHLIRDPVATAASWISRGAYIPPMFPQVPERVLISPVDEGTSFSEYRDRWPSLLPFEKCLFYWAEVNAFALRFEQEFSGRWLRLRYEELFAAQGAATLLEFLNLPVKAEFLDARHTPEDQYRHHRESPCDPKLLERHPQIIHLAKTLGY